MLSQSLGATLQHFLFGHAGLAFHQSDHRPDQFNVINILFDSEQVVFQDDGSRKVLANCHVSRVTNFVELGNDERPHALFAKLAIHGASKRGENYGKLLPITDSRFFPIFFGEDGKLQAQPIAGVQNRNRGAHHGEVGEELTLRV